MISPRAGEDKSAWRVRGKEEDGEFGSDRRRAFYKPVVVTALFFFLSLEPRVSQPPPFSPDALIMSKPQSGKNTRKRKSGNSNAPITWVGDRTM